MVKSDVQCLINRINWLFSKVIAAEGEQRSARALKDAADVISQSPAAIQLRYLQVIKLTIVTIDNLMVTFHSSHRHSIQLVPRKTRQLCFRCRST